MLIKRNTPAIKSSEITDEQLYINRRNLLKTAGTALGAMTVPVLANTPERKVLRHDATVTGSTPDWMQEKLGRTVPGNFSTDEPVTPYEYITGYNNFYEFGTDKEDPSRNAKDFHTDPWSVEIMGEAEVTGQFTLEDILRPHPLEERIYRLRCVEAWSMVVPWIGFPLADLIKRFKPTSKAKYVRFETLFDPERMPGQRSFFSAIDYPYVEGLRMDEATNDLALMAVGLYGQHLPPQNGAPLRLVIPWKYGFKSIKSIVRIEFTSRRPRTTWERSAPNEYGFYANVNPNVDHPRWSQATERRLPGSLFRPQRMETMMFNGYGPQVAHLYSDLNLKRNF